MSDSKLLSADELDAMNAICAMFTHDCASTINPPVRNNPMSELKPLSADAFNIMKAATNGNVNLVNDPVYRQCIANGIRAAVDAVLPFAPFPTGTERIRCKFLKLVDNLTDACEGEQP